MDSDDENDGAHHLHRPVRVVEQVASAAALQMCSYLQILIILCHLVPLWANRKERKRKRQPNVHRDRSSVISLFTPGQMICSSDNLDSLGKISSS